jgi:hypothetical protein
VSIILLIFLIGLGIALIGMLINFRFNSRNARLPRRLTLDEMLFRNRRRNRRSL